jgi:hypothetical protein
MEAGRVDLAPVLLLHGIGANSLPPFRDPVPSVRRSASAAECTGNRLGAFRWRVTDAAAGGAISAHRWDAAGEVMRARDDHRSGFYGRACKNHVEGGLRRAPDALEAARADNLAKPCSPTCAPSAAPTSCDSEVGTQITVEPA